MYVEGWPYGPWCIPISEAHHQPPTGGVAHPIL